MREWIVTNGLGGYASLTSQLTNTRKYHGLLIASLNPPVERWVFASNLHDVIVTNKNQNIFDNSTKASSFSLLPTITCSNDAAIIQKTFFMQYLHNTTIIKYDVLPKEPITLRQYPLISSRHFYSVQPQQQMFNVDLEHHGNMLTVQPNNVDYRLCISIPKANYQPNMCWEYISYEKDRNRNDASDDHRVNIGYFEHQFDKPTTFYVMLSIEDTLPDPALIFDMEMNRRKQLISQANLPTECHKLVLSSDNFIVKKKDRKTIIAGYHWFSDWGRDTLIALPGLTLVTKRYDVAKDILLCLSDTCHKGIIPNTYDDKTGEAAYNTVDASLWFIDRVYQYLKYTNDTKFLEDVFPTMESIISNYEQGTMNNIHMGDDFLICHDPGVTWMDVKMGDFYPTPRNKKAVEIQALWYHDLCIMSKLAQKLGTPDQYQELADQVKQSFLKQYQDQYDVIDTKDAASRPNKLFLVSLDHTMIDAEMQNAIVDDVLTNLITVFGPRTLSRDHPLYKGCYFGDYPRDTTYHNGMVWPWLLGPFISAFVKVKQYDPSCRNKAYKEFLNPMFRIFGDQWDGSIYEIFDGDPIYEPRGCITQAWSVSEILRAWVEDIQGKRPKFEQEYCLNEVRI